MTPTVPPVLDKAISGLSGEAQDAFITHLDGGTSADFLSDWLKRAGQPVGATTIKDYRRKRKEMCK